MSKLFKRKGFRLASVAYFLSLGTLAVSLFAWFSTSSTFSWFASNKEVEANQLAIKVKTDDNASIEMNVYQYSYVENNGTYAWAVQEVTDLSNGVALSRYDKVFEEENAYTPILLKLTLKGGSYSDNESIPLKIAHLTEKDGTDITEDLYEDDGNGGHTQITHKNDDGTTENTKASDQTYGLNSYISSVISVSAAVQSSSSGITWDESDLTTSFESVKSNLTTTKYFVTALKGGNSSATATTKTDIDFSDSLTYSETTSDTCVVYVMIDYDKGTTFFGNESSTEKGLINAYINQMQDITDSTGVNMSYPLLSDFGEITIIKTTSN